jgi:hypothetical protein
MFAELGLAKTIIVKASAFSFESVQIKAGNVPQGG